MVGNGESLNALEQAKRGLSSAYLSRARLRQGLGAGSLLESSYQEKGAWEWGMETGKGENQEGGRRIIQLATLCLDTIVGGRNSLTLGRELACLGSVQSRGFP